MSFSVSRQSFAPTFPSPDPVDSQPVLRADLPRSDTKGRGTGNPQQRDANGPLPKQPTDRRDTFGTAKNPLTTTIRLRSLTGTNSSNTRAQVAVDGKTQLNKETVQTGGVSVYRSQGTAGRKPTESSNVSGYVGIAQTKPLGRGTSTIGLIVEGEINSVRSSGTTALGAVSATGELKQPITPAISASGKLTAKIGLYSGVPELRPAAALSVKYAEPGSPASLSVSLTGEQRIGLSAGKGTSFVSTLSVDGSLKIDPNLAALVNATLTNGPGNSHESSVTVGLQANF